MRIFEQWTVPSDSNPEREYVISRMDDESYACGCLGWTMHYPRRDCKHIALVKSGLGGRMVDPLLAAVVKARHAEERRLERAAERDKAKHASQQQP